MSRIKSNRAQRTTFRRRDYRAEYQRRKASGLASGKSLSASRGHPTAADLPKPEGPIDRTSPYEKALARMKRGASQKAAAEAEGVSVEKLRLYRAQNTTSVRNGRGWTIFDLRPEAYWLATKGKRMSVTLTRDEGSEIGEFWNAVERFLATNNTDHLAAFAGRGVRDILGRFHPYETRPNVLRRMDSIGELHFLEIYADVAK